MNVLRGCVVVAVMALAGAAGSGAEVQADKVTAAGLGFEPTETPKGRLLVASSAEFKRVGEGSFIDRKDGGLMLFFDVRRTTGDLDKSFIRVIRSADGGATWDAGRTAVEDANASILQPSLCRLGDGRLGMTYSRLTDKTHAAKFFAASADEGETWGPPVPLSQGERPYMTGAHDRLIRLASGRLVSLVHGKTPAPKVSHMVSFVYTSNDRGATWVNRTPDGLDVDLKPFAASGEYGFWEPSFVEAAPGRSLLYGRTATGCLYVSRSRDDAAMWSAPEKTALPNPLAPVRLTRVPGTDTLLMFCNPLVDMASGWHGGARNVLAMRASTDGGVTWGPCRLVEFTKDPNQWYDYPLVLWTGDTLHLAYRAPHAKTFECSIYYQRLAKADLVKSGG